MFDDPDAAPPEPLAFPSPASTAATEGRAQLGGPPLGHREACAPSAALLEGGLVDQGVLELRERLADAERAQAERSAPWGSS